MWPNVLAGGLFNSKNDAYTSVSERAPFCVQKRLPDVASILVDGLVRHGMEHDENGVRLWSTLTPSRLMVRVFFVFFSEMRR